MGGGDTAKAVKGTRRAWFEGGWQEAKVYDRYALASGDRIPGPAIIEEYGSTVPLHPGFTARVDAHRNLVVSTSSTTETSSTTGEEG